MKNYIDNIIEKVTNSKELEELINNDPYALIAKEFDKEVVLIKLDQYEEKEKFRANNIYINFETKEYKISTFFDSIWFDEACEIKSFKKQNEFFEITLKSGREISIKQRMEKSSPYIIKLDNGTSGTGIWKKEEIFR